MVLVTVNQAKRLIYYAYIGEVKHEEMKRAREETAELLKHLPAGIRVLGDLERLESMDAASSTEIGAMMDMLDCKGIEVSVRVIPDPSKDIGLSILSTFHYRKKVRIITCASMLEAAKELGL
jgi:hypothetical protein